MKILNPAKQTDFRKNLAPVVKTEFPLREGVDELLRFTGDIEPIRQVTVTARVIGSVEYLPKDIGDRVRAGEVIARLDTTELALQVIQAASTQANAKAIYDRAVELSGKNLVSQQELDNARAASGVAQAALDNARIRLSYAAISAPISGIITKRYLDQGAQITSASLPIYVIADYSSIRISVNVLEREIPKVKPGMRAIIHVVAYPGEGFEGSVARRSESLELSTRTMTVEIDAPNSDGRLRPGMFASADILLSSKLDALTLPSNVILKNDSGYYVWKIREGLSTRQAVLVGSIKGDRTEITSGINPTDSVVTLGYQLLREAGKVRIAGTEPADAGNSRSNAGHPKGNG